MQLPRWSLALLLFTPSHKSVHQWSRRPPLLQSQCLLKTVGVLRCWGGGEQRHMQQPPLQCARQTQHKKTAGDSPARRVERTVMGLRANERQKTNSLSMQRGCSHLHRWHACLPSSSACFSWHTDLNHTWHLGLVSSVRVVTLPTLHTHVELQPIVL